MSRMGQMIVAGGKSAPADAPTGSQPPQLRAPAGALEWHGRYFQRISVPSSKHINAPCLIFWQVRRRAMRPLRGAVVFGAPNRWVRPLARTSHRLRSSGPPGPAERMRPLDEARRIDEAAT